MTTRLPGDDEFHVGWLPEAPPRLRRFTRRAAAAAILAALAIAAALAAGQEPLPDGEFEYGRLRTFEGTVRLAPVPLLEGAGDAVLLVGAGKHGPDAVAHLDGHHVRFRGTLVRRDLSMAEITRPETIEDLGPSPAPRAEAVAIGPVTLDGELVDTKCWLGVMRPATGAVHRACAIRCLSGGVPPGLLVRGDGVMVTVLLASGDGSRLEVDPQLAARHLRASGDLEVRGGVPVLRVASWTVED